MDMYKVDKDFGNEIQDFAKIIQDASKPSFHKDNEIVINLFIVLTREEEDHDVDHYEKGEKFIAFKIKAPPQVETNRQLIAMKNQRKVIGLNLWGTDLNKQEYK